MKPPLLYLTHRIPYPPNKGDKVRSYNLLKALVREHRVFLGTFVDHPDDARHVATLREICVEVCACRLHPALARLASLRGLLAGEALSIPYYRSRALLRWVQQVTGQQAISRGIAFSGPMAQYLQAAAIPHQVIDFCDVDSAKWEQYAERHRGPLAWLYGREGRLLQRFEQASAREARASTFVTEAEAALFRRAAPGLKAQIAVVPNGVDSEYFSPAQAGDSPYAAGGPMLVFTGAMDYWPNIDAVSWFAREVLPLIHQSMPEVRFAIVGMNPGRSVQALAGDKVIVTGTVPDIRPWLAHGTVVVAPLRVARGIQNKVLEAMAMAQPVIATSAAAAGLPGSVAQALTVADEPAQYAAAVLGLLTDQPVARQLGAAAREAVLEHFSWSASMGRFDELLA